MIPYQYHAHFVCLHCARPLHSRPFHSSIVVESVLCWDRWVFLLLWQSMEHGQSGTLCGRIRMSIVMRNTVAWGLSRNFIEILMVVAGENFISRAIRCLLLILRRLHFLSCSCFHVWTWWTQIWAFVCFVSKLIKFTKKFIMLVMRGLVIFTLL